MNPKDMLSLKEASTYLGMDERALDERIASILRRRWLKDVIAVEHDLATATLSYHTDADAIERVAGREWGKRIIFTDRHAWTDEEIITAYRAQSKGENAFRQSIRWGQRRSSSSPPRLRGRPPVRPRGQARRATGSSKKRKAFAHSLKQARRFRSVLIASTQRARRPKRTRNASPGSCRSPRRRQRSSATKWLHSNRS